MKAFPRWLSSSQPSYHALQQLEPDSHVSPVESLTTRTPRSAIKRTRLLLLLVALALSFLLLICWRLQQEIETPDLADELALPDLASIDAYEDSMPQHNADHAEHGRFLYVDAQRMWGGGFNNLWGEIILLHYLAVRSGRSYVFRDIVQADKSRWRLNTFVGGPTGGAGVSDGLPISVSERWFKKVACPSERFLKLDIARTSGEIGLDLNTANATTLIERWAEKLRATPDACVGLFGRWFLDMNFWFAGNRSLTVWPELSKSPILTQHRWSAPVYRAVRRNNNLLTGGAPFSKLAVLHLRRGDYFSHCHTLARDASPYASWNLLPELPDRYDPPGQNATKEEREKAVWPHCLPSSVEIAERLRKEAGDSIEHVFVATNGDEAFLKELRDELGGRGYGSVTTSRDLDLPGIEKDVAMIVDMEIGIRAGLFIGNGFSTFTGTIVALRLVQGRAPETSRFW